MDVSTTDATYNEVNIDEAIEDYSKGISRAAYIKLHRSHSNKLTKNLKEKYERQTSDEKKQVHSKKLDSKSKIPVPKPRLKVKNTNKLKINPPLLKKDENSNDVIRKGSSSSEDYISIVLRSESEESLDKVNKELSLFTMDKNPKEKKRGSSFRRIFMGKIFSKDNKKKEEEKPVTTPHKETVSLNDNIKNESNDFNRQTNLRHTISGNDPNELRQTRPITKQMEDRYAQMHIREFHQIKNNFENHKAPEKPARSNGLGTITYRRFEPQYGDASSSASTLTSEGTFGENASTKLELKLVNSNAIIPINSERPLPNPYQFGRNSEEIYVQQRNSPASSDSKMKRSPSIEVSKLKLPPNRDVSLPRVKSPVSHDYYNTDKEIATELLKPKRSPTPNQNMKTLSPTQKALASSVNYPENIRNLSPSQQNSSSSVEYRDNIFEDRRDESFPQNRQAFFPVVNKDGIYEKMVNEALSPVHDEEKRGSFSPIYNIHGSRANQSQSPVYIEDRRNEPSPIMKRSPSSEKENSYEKRLIGRPSPSPRMFLQQNNPSGGGRSKSESPYGQASSRSANENQIARKNVNESFSPTRRMFQSLNMKRDSPCDDRRNDSGTPVSAMDQEEIYRRNACGSLNRNRNCPGDIRRNNSEAPVSPTDQDQFYRNDAYVSMNMPSSSSTAHQTSLDYPDNVQQNNANRNVEPQYSSRFQNRQNQSISRNESPQYSSRLQNKDKFNMDRDEGNSSPADSQRSSRCSENQSVSRASDQDLWKTRQNSDYAAFHSPGSYHSSPSSDQVKQTVGRLETTENNIQNLKTIPTGPTKRNSVNMNQNIPKYLSETEQYVPVNQSIPRSPDHMANHPSSNSRMNSDFHRNTQNSSNQRSVHLLEDQGVRPNMNPNELRHTFDNNQNRYMQSEQAMSVETRQNRGMYPPQNINHNLQHHRNIAPQNMRHSTQPWEHQLIRNIPPPPRPQRQVFFPPESPNYGVYKNVPPPVNLVRSSTPTNLNPSPSKPISPQKEDLRRSVEAYYWKEIKKLKEQENLELSYYQMNMVPYMAYAEDPGSLRRSRSSLPSERNSRRSLSLPRNVPNNDNSNEPVMIRQHPVPRPVIYQNDPIYGQQFKRNTPERRTVDGSNRTNSIYRPIFKRGSLTTPVKQQDDPQYKKVSFRHFKENLPRRQNEHINSRIRSNNVQQPVRYSMNMGEGVYGNPNEIYPRYVPQVQQNRYPNIPEQEIQHVVPRGVTRHGSIQLQEGIYDRRPPVARKPSVEGNFTRRGADLPKREIIMGDNEIFGQFGGYLPNEEPMYGSNMMSAQESIYGQCRGPKQIIVSDKVCDMYGQIHDRNSPTVVRKSGVMMGRLQQQAPQAPIHQSQETPEFLQRNSRLTSSATDIRSGRIQNMPQQNPHPMYQEGIYSEYPPSRPLPPVPNNQKESSKPETSKGAKEHRRRSGSTSSVKTKKKGFFGE
ncbi:unnamed protein product [Acanthoscelides obtectus]|uniref:Uncharacterized protein n=1 Tax=Acanthoscelides obtectus TaxID=200917 RepID=A0A9P0JQA6_ACAOB|nr:unnamed protein product [Acanthoscelides obtectus]CAK1625889.1 hypothetical protein AOBTE_LOCUS3459 [Acanthoscelides obtectus]